MALFDWAWMNLCTRCFGHAQAPGDITMCPLLDLLNHSPVQEDTAFYCSPEELNKKMMKIDNQRAQTEEEEQNVKKQL
jgi:hypothetical protein